MGGPCFSRETLLALLEERLPPPEQSRVAGHLNECAACEALVEAIVGDLHVHSIAPEEPSCSRPADPADLRTFFERLKHVPAIVRENGETPTLAGTTSRGGAAAAGKVAITSEPMPAGIGPYQLTEILGRGGFGVVYRAEQEQPLRRTVALKVIRPGMGSREVLARFEAERQALALMDHPHIARVLDAGSTAEGQPYFVMELVDGVPITRYCDDRRLPVRRRLELFVSVCQAVQHAHLKGLIHRDLKPSNVLVAERDGQPLVKVIDFGIAKALGQADADPGLTTAGQMIGTPLYMSPEQAGSAASVDTRSDVYSLGALLYELLAGTTPFDAERLRQQPSLFETLRIIREEEPVRPSVRLLQLGTATEAVAGNRTTSARELVRMLRSDLDWIVLKTLEKDRERRYESAGALARDVERMLGHEAVQACPPSVLYRSRKLVRRNLAAVTASGIVAVALITATVLSGWQARVAIGERKRADEKAKLAESIVEKFFSDFAQDWVRNQPEMSALQEEFLQSAADYYSALDQQAGLDPETKLKAGRTQCRLGSLYRMLGNSSGATSALRKGIRLLEDVHTAAPLQQEPLRELAATRIEFGSFLLSERQLPAAEREYRAALSTIEPALRTHGDDRALRLLESRARNHLGETLTGSARRQCFQDALALQSALLKRHPDDVNCLRLLAFTHLNLAGGSNLPPQPVGNRQEAQEREAHYQEAIRLLDEVEQRKPEESLNRHHRAMARYSFGNYLHFTGGRHAEARDHYERALRDYERLAQAHPGFHAYDESLQLVRSGLGGAYAHLGELATALYHWKPLLEGAERIIRRKPGGCEWRRLWVNRCMYTMDLYERLRFPQEADRLFQKAQDRARELRRAHREDAEFARGVAELVSMRARGLLQRADWRGAVAAFEEAVRIDPGNPGSADELARLLVLCPEKGVSDPARARELARNAIRLAPARPGLWTTQGVAEYRMGRHADAVQSLARSIELARGGILTDWLLLAMAHHQLGHTEDADRWFECANDWMGANRFFNEEQLQFRREAMAVFQRPMHPPHPTSPSTTITIHLKSTPQVEALREKIRTTRALPLDRWGENDPPEWHAERRQLIQKLEDLKHFAEARAAAAELLTEMDIARVALEGEEGESLTPALRQKRLIDIANRCCSDYVLWFRYPVEGERALKMSSRIWQMTPGQFMDAKSLRREQIRADEKLGRLLVMQSKSMDAIPLLKRAEAAFWQGDPAEREEQGVYEGLMIGHLLAIALTNARRMTEARAVYRRQVARFDHPQHRPVHPVIRIPILLALAQVEAGPDEADAVLLEALRLGDDELRKATHQFQQEAAAEHLTNVLLCRATVLASQGRIDDALASVARAKRIVAGVHAGVTSRQINAVLRLERCAAALGWFLATAPDPRLRDPEQAAHVARIALESRSPPPDLEYVHFWRIRGVADYRAGNYPAAWEALQKAVAPGKPDPAASIFLALTCRQLKQEGQARQWWAVADEWVQQHPAAVEEVLRFHAEAAEILGKNS